MGNLLLLNTLSLLVVQEGAAAAAVAPVDIEVERLHYLQEHILFKLVEEVLLVVMEHHHFLTDLVLE